MKRLFAQLNMAGAVVLWVFGFDVTADAPGALVVLYYITAAVMFAWGANNSGFITSYRRQP